MMLPRDLLRNCASNYPDRPAYFWRDETRTWQEMKRRSDRLAGAFMELGVEKGDVVAILGRESLEIYEHFFACMTLGAVRVGLNWRYSPGEILHILQDSRPRVLLLQADCASLIETLEQEIADLDTRVILYGDPGGALHEYEEMIDVAVAPSALPDLESEDPMFISYTSGSTGRPKGVVHTQYSSAYIIFQNLVGRGLAPNDIFLQASASSWMTVLLNMLGLGNGMAHAIMDGTFEIVSFMKQIDRHRVTSIMLVPTLLQRVLQERAKGDYDLSSIRLLNYGSSPITPELARSAYAAFDCDLIQNYGMTEGGWVTHLSADDHVKAVNGEYNLLESVGRPGVLTRISIRNADGEELPPGEVGEVCLSSPMLMKGYLNLPDATAEALKDGWLHTNDLGCLNEEGYLFLHGRKNFMITSGAVNVQPQGVELVISEHPSVFEVAVVGAPHPDLGEAVVAVVVCKPGREEPTQRDIESFCLARLSKLSIPKHVYIVSELPKTLNGKLNKPKIIQWVQENLHALPWFRVQGAAGGQ